MGNSRSFRTFLHLMLSKECQRVIPPIAYVLQNEAIIISEYAIMFPQGNNGGGGEELGQKLIPRFPAVNQSGV